MSWLMYATRSTMPDDLPLVRLGLARARVLEDPVAHLPREVEPLRRRSRSECSLWRKPGPNRSRSSSSSASSPAWPNGGWPMSCPSPIASVRSSFRRSARATPRAIPVVSSVCVMPRPEVVAGGVDEDLRLALQPPERLRVQDPVAVALERRAQAAFVLRARAPACLVGAHGERREPRLFVLAIRDREAVRDLSGDLRHRRSAYPARRGAGSNPNVDTCADAPPPPSRRPACRRMRLGQQPARRRDRRGARVQPASGRDDALLRGHVFVRVLENVRGRRRLHRAVDRSSRPTTTSWSCCSGSTRSGAPAPRRSRRSCRTSATPRATRRTSRGCRSGPGCCAERSRSAGADRVVTMDLHAPQIQGFFRIPVDDLYALPVLVDAIRDKELPDLVVVSPDAGFAKKARALRRTPARRRWPSPTRSASTTARPREVARPASATSTAGDALIVDDFTITGRHARRGRRVARRAGRALGDRRGDARCVHRRRRGKLDESPIERLFFTDTVENQPQPLAKVEVVSVAALFAEAIRRIHDRESISVLFRE